MNIYIHRFVIKFSFISVLFSQIDFDLPDDSASFAILICDYDSGAFEQGAILNVPLCPGCDSLAFPFNIEFQPAIDFGWIQFNYSATNDTIFHGEIIWMGTGQILFPRYFYYAVLFNVENEVAGTPDTTLYWQGNGTVLSEDSLILSARNSIDNITSLNIVHQFAEYPYKLLVYLYTPSVGTTDWSVAKWIIFIFRNPEVIKISDELSIPQNFKLFQSYPNPFNPTTTIRFSIPVETSRQVGTMSLQMFDITGRLVETLVKDELQTGEHEIVWNAGSQPSGVYFVRLESGEFVETQKVLLMK